MPSFLAHSSSESVQDVRRGPRPRNAGSHGDVVQRSSRRWTATGSGAPVGFIAHEDGRFRPSFGSQNFPSCFLGVMGRHSLHDSDSSSRNRGAAMRQMGAREAAGLAGHTLVQAQVRFCAELPRNPSSSCNLLVSAPLFWSGCVFHWISQRLCASAEGSSTAKAATEQRVHDQADCVRVQWHQNELWPVSVVRLEPSCGSTRISGT